MPINSLTRSREFISKFKILLDPERPFDGNDYRFLASKLGKTQQDIHYLGTTVVKADNSPTEVLLLESNITLGELRHHFGARREDVIDKIDDFVNKVKQECNCANCASLR